eukprot:scaffold310340_cov27-Tisochrysis_lutea.AAC.1
MFRLVSGGVSSPRPVCSGCTVHSRGTSGAIGGGWKTLPLNGRGMEHMSTSPLFDTPLRGGNRICPSAGGGRARQDKYLA